MFGDVIRVKNGLFVDFGSKFDEVLKIYKKYSVTGSDDDYEEYFTKLDDCMCEAFSSSMSFRELDKKLTIAYLFIKDLLDVDKVSGPVSDVLYAMYKELPYIELAAKKCYSNLRGSHARNFTVEEVLDRSLDEFLNEHVLTEKGAAAIKEFFKRVGANS